MQPSRFGEYWAKYASRSVRSRKAYFDALPQEEQRLLLESFYSENWPALFFRNMLDETLDEIKRTYNIDLIDLRIKALRCRRTFLIERDVWEHIEQLTCAFDDHIDISFLFAGLTVTAWGKERQFYIIRARRR